MLNSVACRYTDFSTPWYRDRESELKIRDIYHSHSASQVEFINRKFWEWCVIVQALQERSKLRLDAKGLGFAVGTEPLSSFFAAKGCRILATDLSVESSQLGWIERNEHAASKNALYYPQLIEREPFDERVMFQSADMRTLKGLSGSYDFIWSSCALEHLGSLQAGIDFVLESSMFLKPGGVAVHTTEFNVRSNDETVTSGSNVVYRQKDLLNLEEALRLQGLKLAMLNFDTGDHPFDLDVDIAPYMQPGKRHLKLDISGHVATSFLLIIEKLPEAKPNHSWRTRLNSLFRSRA